MGNSESQHKKHPGGRKPKFDYRGEEFAEFNLQMQQNSD